MIAHESLLVTLVKLVGRLPLCARIALDRSLAENLLHQGRKKGLTDAFQTTIRHDRA
jgi:hypothetical protein